MEAKSSVPPVKIHDITGIKVKCTVSQKSLQLMTMQNKKICYMLMLYVNVKTVTTGISSILLTVTINLTLFHSEFFNAFLTV